MQLQKLGTERMQEIIEFDHLCFPNNFWKEEEWESLLRDERAIYYALLDDGRIVGSFFATPLCVASEPEASGTLYP